MVSATKARAVGFNHVTTGVGDIDAITDRIMQAFSHDGAAVGTL